MKTTTLLLATLAVIATACGGSKSSDPATDEFTNDQVLAVKTIEDENGNVDDSLTQATLLQGDYQSADDVKYALNNGYGNWQSLDYVQSNNSYGCGFYDDEEYALFAAAKGDNKTRRNAKNRRNGNNSKQARNGKRNKNKGQQAKNRRHKNKHWKKHRRNGNSFRRFRWAKHWSQRFTPRHRVYRYRSGVRCSYDQVYYGGRCVQLYNPYVSYQCGLRGGYYNKRSHNKYERVRIYY